MASTHLIVEVFPGKEVDIEEVSVEWKDNSNRYIREVAKLTLSYLRKYDTARENIYFEILETYLRVFKVRNGILLQKDEDQPVCLAVVQDGERKVVESNIFHNFDELLQKPFEDGYFVISNEIKNDPRVSNDTCQSGLRNFLGIPFNDGIDSVQFMIGLANRESGFDPKDLARSRTLIHITEEILINLLSRIREGINILQEINTAKKSFLATVSHEVRTPLTSMLGMSTQLMRNSDNMTEKQKNQLRILNTSGLQLLELLNDILDYSRMKAQKLTLENKEFSLKEVATSAIDTIRHDAQEKNLHLHMSIINQIPDILVGDRKRIHQILVNLLKNACKFTDSGSISLEIQGKLHQVHEIGPDCWNITFQVRDTGIGIPEEYQEEIFHDFTQVHKDQIYNGSHNGTGLGLAICRELVHLMKGKIWIESDGVSGSSFFVNICLVQRPNLSELLEKNASILVGNQILVVDDKETNRTILTDLLFDWGMIPMPFATAREALDYLSRNRMIRVALIDVCMPYMSGIEMAQKIRENDTEVRMIGLSSAGHDVQGKDWFDRYQTKPIDEYLLLTNLIECCQSIGHETIRIPRVSSPKKISIQPSNVRIIIAEDDKNNRDSLIDILETLGYKNVECAHDGVECVRMIRSKKYDVCFMDIKMPGLNGWEAAEKIRFEKNRPMIVAVTASVDPSEKDKCMQIGMDGYLGKPYTHEQLQTVIDAVHC